MASDIDNGKHNTDLQLASLLRSVVARFDKPPTDEALGRDLRDALRLPDAEAAAVCGSVLLEAGLAREAEPIFKALARFYSRSAAGPVGLAQVAMRRGAWAEALARWDGILAQFGQKSIPGWLASRATTLAELGRIDEARAIFEGLARDFPWAPAGFAGLAQIVARQRRWKEALNALDDLLLRFSDPRGRSYWKSSRAIALFELGEVAAAESALRAVVQAHPGVFAPFWTLLQILLKAGYQARALELIDSDPLRDVRSSILAGTRSVILIRLHKFHDARLAFARAMHEADNVTSIDRLFPLIPQLYDGWSRVESWLGVLAKLDAATALHGCGGTLNCDVLRARVYLALRDQRGFLATMKRIGVQGIMGKQLAAVAAKLQEPDFGDQQRPKVFGIGLSRTGTTTLASALTTLGLSTVHYHNPLTYEPFLDEDLHCFEAFTDIPVSLAFEKYYYMFPNSKFIHTTRPIDAWLKSMDRHFEWQLSLSGFDAVEEALRQPNSTPYGRAFRDLHHALYFNFANYSEAYRAHDIRVRRFFSDKPKDRFLEFDVFRGDGWPELCAFLGVQIPVVDFPWENRRTNGAG